MWLGIKFLIIGLVEVSQTKSPITANKVNKRKKTETRLVKLLKFGEPVTIQNIYPCWTFKKNNSL